MRQYEIWWANLPRPAGRRPVLLLSRDGAYAFLNKVVAAEITTTIRRIPIEVPLGRDRRAAEEVRCQLRQPPDDLQTKPGRENFATAPTKDSGSKAGGGLRPRMGGIDRGTELTLSGGDACRAG